MNRKPINEQVIVLFGASSGIGREAALQLAAKGARVVVAARGEGGLNTLVAEICAKGGQAVAIVADTTDFDQVKAVADHTVAHYGQLDTWVHVAGVALYSYFWETPPAEFKRLLEVNLLGQAYGAMAALPHMMERGGALIHISSLLAQRAFPLQAAYSAAKHGVNGFTEALRIELRHANIPVTVTTIMPTSTNTPFFDKAKSRIGVKPIGMPPIYSPRLVVDAILYAIEHPVRDLVVGDAGKLISFAQRLAPQLVDELVVRTGFEGQMTKEPEAVDGPNNLFHPVTGYDHSQGSFAEVTTAFSPYTQLEVNPQARRFVKGVALLGMAVLMARWLKKT